MKILNTITLSNIPLMLVAITFLLTSIGSLTSAQQAKVGGIGAAKANKKIRPSSILLSGYYAIKEAEKLEADKEYKAAWNRYHKALRYYQTLSNNFPEWKQDIVNYRLKSTQEKIDKVFPQAQQEHLLTMDKIKDFKQKNTSESGIQSPELSDKINKKATPNFSRPRPKSTPQVRPRNEVQITANKYQQELKKIKSQHRLEKALLSRKIGKLSDDLRRANQGLLTDSTQTRILNNEIKGLTGKLLNSEKRSKEAQAKLLNLYNELTLKRDQLAAAPLKKDVEKLKKEKLRYAAELDKVVGMHKRHLLAHKKLIEEKNKLQRELKFSVATHKAKSKELEISKTASHKIIRSLRTTIKAQHDNIVRLEGLVAKLDLQNQELEQKLANTNSLNKELKNQLSAVTLERDQLSELLNLSDADRAKRTIKEALRLGEVVRKQEAIIKQLQKDKNVAQDQIVAEKSKLAVAKRQILDLEEENTDYSKRIGSLEDSLKATRDQLNKSLAKTDASPIDTAEAVELKKTLQRLTTQLERKKQAENILWKEYQRSNQQGSNLGFAIANLINRKVTLTANDKKLLRDKADTDSFTRPGAKLKTPAQRQAALAKIDTQVESLESLALRCVAKGHLQTAKEVYDEAYDAHGHHYPFFINRGVVRYKLQEYKEAEEIFESGTQLKEKSPYTHFMLGMCRFHNHKDELAKKSMKTAISLRPDFTNAYIYLGIISSEQGNLKDAIKYCEKAVRLDPENKDAQYNLSYAYHVKGDNKKAREAYNNALRSGLPPMLDYEKQIGIKKTR